MLRPPLLIAAAHLLALTACIRAAPGPAPAPRDGPLQPYESEQEWAENRARRAREQQRLSREAPREGIIEHPHYHYLIPHPEPEVPVQSRSMPVRPGPARTTVQSVAEVDPGPLARVHGEFMVLLHRGRLFSVRIGAGALEPVSVMDPSGPHTNPAFAAYDEILISGNRVVLVNAGGARGDGVQLIVYHLAPDGKLTHRATYDMATAGGLSRLNGRRVQYSRGVGDRLVFDSEIQSDAYQREASAYNDFPRIYRRAPGSSTRVPPTAPTLVYRPAAASRGGTMHTVTSCALAEDDLRCQSVAAYGASSHASSVSGTAVYVWTREKDRYWDEKEAPRNTLYRLPLDGSAPSAVGVAGVPVNAFSFHESADGHVNVLVRKDASGGVLWGAERGLALLRVPLAQLGRGGRSAVAAQYRALPEVLGYRLRHRFVGDWLVYGTGPDAGEPAADSSTAYAVRVAGGEVARIALPHGTDRIERTGSGAVILGGKGAELHLTTLRLASPGTAAAAHHRIPGLEAGWRLALGAFSDAAGGGVLALPLQEPARPGASLPTVGSARIVLLRDDGSRLEPLGSVAAGDPARDDGCMADCGAWFGNARPIFAGGRILAVMGYELVEASVADGRLRELRRVDLTPLAPGETLAGDWEFTEELGPEVAAYRCRNRGTLRLDRDGQALTMRYRQTGECTVNGVTTPSDGEGSGTGTLTGSQFTLTVNGCNLRGRMESTNAFSAFVSCPHIQQGTSGKGVEGRLEARRTPP